MSSEALPKEPVVIDQQQSLAPIARRRAVTIIVGCQRRPLQRATKVVLGAVSAADAPTGGARPAYLRSMIEIIATSMNTTSVPTAVKIDGLMLNVALVCSATRPSSCGQV